MYNIYKSIFLVLCFVFISCDTPLVQVKVKNNYFESVHNIVIQGQHFGSIETNKKSNIKTIAEGKWAITARTESNLVITSSVSVSKVNAVTVVISEYGTVILQNILQK